MATQYQTLEFEWSIKCSSGVGNELSELGAVRFKISKLDELGDVSFGILKLGDESFLRILENELGELSYACFLM